MDPKMTAKMVGIFFIMIATVLLSLVVFDALEIDEVTDNLAKLAAVSGIVVVATFLVSLIQRMK